MVHLSEVFRFARTAVVAASVAADEVLALLVRQRVEHVGAHRNRELHRPAADADVAAPVLLLYGPQVLEVRFGRARDRLQARAQAQAMGQTCLGEERGGNLGAPASMPDSPDHANR